MKNLSILLFILLLFSGQQKGKSQPDTLLDDNYLNMAVLLVDYTTYQFLGGNFAHYQKCYNCSNDSLPFDIDYQPPGDFGGITFHIGPTGQLIFDATIIWMGTGQIYYPVSFSQSYPFNETGNLTPNPGDIEYFDMDGQHTNDPEFIQKADSAWYAIDSLLITGQYFKEDYQAGIYLYPPSVGVFDPNSAKWVIFLYYNQDVSSIPKQIENTNPFIIYPNPAKNFINICTVSDNDENYDINILDTKGQLFLAKRMPAGISRLNISELPDGFYVVRIMDNKNIYHKILVVLRD